MSSVASTFSYRFQTAGSCFGPSFTELARKLCRKARSYWNSISRLTTRSSFGIRWSAAVAARSAGCWYAFGEMSARRWRMTSAPATRSAYDGLEDAEGRAEERARFAGIHRRGDAHCEAVAAGCELAGREGDPEGLSPDGHASLDHDRRVLRQPLDPRAVGAVEVAAQAEAEAGVAGGGAVELRLHREPQARAAGDDAAPRRQHGRARRREARLRRAVRVVEARLPAVEVGLVDRVEEEEAADGRLAERERDRLRVVGALGGRVGRLRRRRLAAGVERRLVGRDLRLDAVLVVDDRERRAGLRRPVEGGAEERDELAVVAEPDRGRARVLEVGRLARVVAVRVEGELVHDRLRPPARLVRRTHVRDERGRGVRVAPGVRPVDAARRDGAAEHGDLRGHGLERVVRLREERLVGGRGHVASVQAELRQPVAVQVRLVADDVVAHVPERARDVRSVRG